MMSRLLYTVAIALAAPLSSAQDLPPAPPSQPAPFVQQPDPSPPEDAFPEPPLIVCDLKASPDYVPGVDVKGREVAPADVPGGQEVEIDTQAFVETRSRNRQMRGAGVIVNLPGLGAPACVPIEVLPPPQP